MIVLLTFSLFLILFSLCYLLKDGTNANLNFWRKFLLKMLKMTLETSPFLLCELQLYTKFGEICTSRSEVRPTLKITVFLAHRWMKTSKRPQTGTFFDFLSVKTVLCSEWLKMVENYHIQSNATYENILLYRDGSSLILTIE